MDTCVTVPLTLLEDIFRLLDYLDRRDNYDQSHFYKAGYSHRLEHDNALWELRLKIRQLHVRTVETYLLTVNDATESELHYLQKWVDDGNSVYDNPYYLFNDRGFPMDFIQALRADEDMFNNSDDYFYSTETAADADDLPF